MHLNRADTHELQFLYKKLTHWKINKYPLIKSDNHFRKKKTNTFSLLFQIQKYHITITLNHYIALVEQACGIPRYLQKINTNRWLKYVRKTLLAN